MKTRLVAAGLIAAAGFLMSQERFDYKVRNYFFAGFAGDTASLEKAMKLCEQSLSADPKNAEALVWHGSGLFYQSGQAFQKGDMQSGMQLWQRGIKEMDDAVAMAPDNLGVRIPRGAVLLTATHYISDPERTRPLIERGISDFERAYEVQGPTLGQMGTHPRGELLIGLAEGYSRLGKQELAQQWFERIQKDMQGTPYEKSANTWLETNKLTAAQAGCIGCHTGK